MSFYTGYSLSDCSGEAPLSRRRINQISRDTPHTNRQNAQREIMMPMHSGVDEVVKHRMLQAKALSREARGGRLSLGKKISVPQDVMIEELNLPSNRGSRMFQERQKRAERFTLENAAIGAHNNISAHPVAVPPPQITEAPRGGKENKAISIPGYSGPLKEIPREKFNTTVIPRSYCSPWREALGRNDELLEALSAQLAPLPQRYQPAKYRCFNRSAMPFGGGVASKRVIPIIGFEALESQTLPGAALDRMCQRPNFNRAPTGWGGHHCPESNDL
ncbi:myozenin-2-like isoform X2 [Dunckerocampus dactyliophorus]|uniref:myozenin-2-like isoform X2 n=1 Tax=Dunckerocampus dactyliophorus TaxID=161453 RepID=UPI0024066278|nr:myozenin-2-like isoform X2 [Dunckerocampus dactyliophorus]